MTGRRTSGTSFAVSVRRQKQTDTDGLGRRSAKDSTAAVMVGIERIQCSSAAGRTCVPTPGHNLRARCTTKNSAAQPTALRKSRAGLSFQSGHISNPNAISVAAKPLSAQPISRAFSIYLALPIRLDLLPALPLPTSFADSDRYRR